MDSYLFNGRSRLRDTLAEHRRAAVEAVKQLRPASLTGTSGLAEVQRIVDETTYELPEFDMDAAVSEILDAQLDARNLTDRFVRDRSKPVYIPATTFRFLVPVKGSEAFFHQQPGSVVLYTPPQGRLVEQNRFVEWTETLPADQLDDDTGARVEQNFRRWAKRVSEFVGYAAADVGHHNTLVAGAVETAAHSRREKFQRDAELANSLTVPLRRRAEADEVNINLERRKPLKTKRRSSRRANGLPQEPALTEESYEQVVDHVIHLARTAERLPQTFGGLHEESIRDLILFNLNGTFEGKASGEVFNGKGRTDVLIREQDRNIFIGECKIWDGPKKFSKAIDQLLDYLVWRDTRAALILIIKNKDATSIIRKAHAAMARHPSFFSELSSDDADVRQDYLLTQLDDEERRIQVAVIPVIIRT